MNTKNDWESELNALVKKAGKEEYHNNGAKAVEYYKQAIDLIPDPFEESPHAMRLLTAVGEYYYLAGDFERAFDYFSQAVRAKGGLGWSPIHMRLGQLRYERGEMERAKDELMRAYMGSGKLIFGPEDEKYYDLIRDEVERERP
jgi:tetratricopeptide (TPR) repeat protein